MIVQETAILLLDYNRHAIPLDRLACSPAESRQAFQDWLAGGSGSSPRRSGCPSPSSTAGTREADGHSRTARRAPAAGGRRLPRDGGVHRDRFPGRRSPARRDDPGPVRSPGRRARAPGPPAERPPGLPQLPAPRASPGPADHQSLRLLRGLPVPRPDRLPAVARDRRGGRRALGMAVRGVYRVVHEILHPRVDQDEEVPSDTYWAALRKIHRMRKPVFMGSLWLRARFDVEYLGLPLPTAPPGIAARVADGERPRLHRRVAAGPDHRRADPPRAPAAAGVDRPLAPAVRLDLRRAAAITWPARFPT